MDNLRVEGEREVGEWREKYRTLESEYSAEIQTLQVKADDRRDRELIR